MRCNFTVDCFVQLSGDFGTIDIHNSYQLASFERDYESGIFRMAFKATRQRGIHEPQAFELHFTGVDLVEIDGLPSDLTGYCIHQVVFMDAADRDYDHVPGEGAAALGQHIVFIGEYGQGERATVRVQGASAELLLGR